MEDEVSEEYQILEMRDNEGNPRSCHPPVTMSTPNPIFPTIKSNFSYVNNYKYLQITYSNFPSVLLVPPQGVNNIMFWNP
jgi:hypothetical protein